MILRSYVQEAGKHTDDLLAKLSRGHACLRKLRHLFLGDDVASRKRYMTVARATHMASIRRTRDELWHKRSYLRTPFFSELGVRGTRPRMDLRKKFTFARHGVRHPAHQPLSCIRTAAGGSLRLLELRRDGSSESRRKARRKLE